MKKRCLCTLLFVECTVPEPSNIVDDFTVSVQRDGEVVVRHLMKNKSCRLAKTIFNFLRADKNNCTVVVTGKAYGEGMQVPCTLHFKGHQKFVDVLKKDLSDKV